MNLPRLFARANRAWALGDHEIAGVGRAPCYVGSDWLGEALRKLRRGATPDWTLVMARACCRVLAELDHDTGPEEMAEHLPEALHDEWVEHSEYAAWIAGDPARAFEQLDRIRDECPGLGSAEAAELAMQREAVALGLTLIHAAEREWRSRSCPVCGAYPFRDALVCDACPDRSNGSRSVGG